jgi:sodium-dependent dicarboxylate transporter 2/3/5
LAVILKLEETFGAERVRPLALGLMLAIAYGCSIGGIATPLGTPPNLIYLSALEKLTGQVPGFLDGMAVATPVSAMLVVVAMSGSPAT